MEGVQGNLNIQCTCCQCPNILYECLHVLHLNNLQKKKILQNKTQNIVGETKELTEHLQHEETQLNHSQ